MNTQIPKAYPKTMGLLKLGPLTRQLSFFFLKKHFKLSKVAAFSLKINLYRQSQLFKSELASQEVELGMERNQTGGRRRQNPVLAIITPEGRRPASWWQRRKLPPGCNSLVQTLRE